VSAPAPGQAARALVALVDEILDDVEHVVDGNAEWIDRDMLNDYSERYHAYAQALAAQEPRAADGKTGGQLAYEAFKAWRAERDPMMLVVDWTHPMAEAAREGWEAAAAAVETQQVRLAREDRDAVRGRMLALAAELEAEAYELVPVTGPHYEFPDIADEARHEALLAAAAKIRKGLDV
jgi:hypothetical protein